MSDLQGALFESKNVTEQFIADRFPQVSPMDFYRELFPSGELAQRGQYETGKYCGIAVRLADDRPYRYSITDDLGKLSELIESDDFCLMSPVSYAGKTQKQSMARWLYAVTLDLDAPITRPNKAGNPTGISEFFYEQGNGLFPMPTFIVSSGTGLHLYYMLERPVALFPNVIRQLSNLRHDLILRVWNRYISELSESPQFESVTQGFRIVGTVTKTGDRVRAYRTGERVTIDELNGYVFDDANKVTEFRYKSPHTLEEAKELYPDWYEKRIAQGMPRGRWQVNRALYDWWKRQAHRSAYGHRYYFITALAVYAIKCGISEEELTRDALELVPVLDQLDESHPFTRADALKALDMYHCDYQTFPRRSIQAVTGIQIPPNRRNYVSQSDHLEIARAIRDVKMKQRGRSWTDGNSRKGRPNKSYPKREQVQAWRKANPGGRKIDCERELGISRPTVLKWWDA